MVEPALNGNGHPTFVSGTRVPTFIGLGPCPTGVHLRTLSIRKKLANRREIAMNKLKPVNVGLSLSGTVAVLYLLCALFVWVVPNGVESAIKLVSHSMNLDPVFEGGTTITFAGVLMGTIAVAIYFFVAGTVFGWIYNRFVKA